VWTTPAAIDLRVGFQRRPLFHERGAQFPLDLIRLILPVDELAALERDRFIRRDQLLPQGKIDRIQPLTGLLAIRP
jgi:hypothetical protein